jgi:hypothetical protein
MQQASNTSQTLYGLDFLGESVGWVCGSVGTILHTTNGGGITSVESTVEIPSSFEFKQNYPNPFNSETIIRYAITKTSQARLSVFDVLGQEVAELANGLHEPGQYAIRWNGEVFPHGDAAPSGVYFYRLSANTQNLIGKMILMK